MKRSLETCKTILKKSQKWHREPSVPARSTERGGGSISCPLYLRPKLPAPTIQLWDQQNGYCPHRGRSRHWGSALAATSPLLQLRLAQEVEPTWCLRATPSRQSLTLNATPSGTLLSWAESGMGQIDLENFSLSAVIGMCLRNHCYISFFPTSFPDLFFHTWGQTDRQTKVKAKGTFQFMLESIQSRNR